MGVKRYPKSTESEQKRALFNRNWHKSTVFEQVLYPILWIGEAIYYLLFPIYDWGTCAGRTV